MDLRIRTFSQSAEKQMNLISGDVGRPVAHLRGYLNLPTLDEMVAGVIKSLAPHEADVETVDAASYRMRIAAYKTGDHAIRGAVLEFIRRATASSGEAPHG